MTRAGRVVRPKIDMSMRAVIRYVSITSEIIVSSANDRIKAKRRLIPRFLVAGAVVVGLLVGVLACSPAHNQVSSGPSTHNVTFRAKVTANDLLSAPVPSVCMHKAGTLVKGIQRGIPENHGSMQLAWLQGGAKAREALTAFGELSEHGIGDAATVLDCNAGGVSWPQVIAFYSPGPALLGWTYLTAFSLPGRQAQQNTFVRRLIYHSGGVEVEWSTQEEQDPAAVSSLDYSALLRLSGHKIVASNLTGTTEQKTVKRFLQDLRHGDRSAANRLAAPAAAVEAASEFRIFPSALAATPKCYGLVHSFDMLASLAALIDAGGPKQVNPETDRLCTLSTGDSGVRWIALGMRHTGFRTWRVLWSKTVGYA